MNTFQYLLFFICAGLYVCAVLVLLLTAGTRCIYCNRHINVVRHAHYGAPVCDKCWRRIWNNKP